MSWRSVLLVLSAVAFAVMLHMPEIAQRFPFWAIQRGAFYADILFHEVGHALFAWALGYPSIPSIFTFFGSDQAGGMALTYPHSWPVQVAAWAVMGYGVWWLWRETLYPWAVVAASVAIALFFLSFWRHHTLIISYMGHGSAIVMGCYFLYRGLLDLMARHGFERWLNVFLGSFMLLHNGLFAWSLAFDAAAQNEYRNRMIFGAVHHDFMAMQEEWFFLSVQGIAKATVFLALLGLTLTLVLAFLRRHDEID